MQYVQISNLIDTAIECPMSDQTTIMVKGCMDIMFVIIDTAFHYNRALIVCQFLQESSQGERK